MESDETWSNMIKKRWETPHLYKSIQGNPDDLKSQKINKPTTFNKNPTSATFKTVAFFVHDMNMHYRGVLKLGSCGGPRIWVKC